MRAAPTLDDQLFEAVKNVNISRIENLLGKGADINALNESGETPLSVACHADSRETLDLMVDYLISKGADLNKFDPGGCTPLFYAVAGNKPHIVQTLLELGANPNINFDPQKNPFVKSTVYEIIFKRYLSAVIREKKGYYDDFNVLQSELLGCRSIMFLLTEAGARRFEREIVPEYS